MKLPNYIITKNMPDGSALRIKDIGPWDEYPTITNSAEELVPVLIAKGLLPKGRRLFYTDSDGQMDELLIKDGRFVGFSPLPENIRSGDL